ncbi:helix-turn-helix domain-containing protein [Mameliella alba]|uniref:helix-turn-helix domain-containing protein n=1 Tax=Mameliella alba TaxID=561184 RepID=UPI0005BA9FFB|nr:helix-turn-helix domain-containing protein [Mameliella alba]
MSNREELVAKYIDDLKKHVGADTDSELAKLLSLDKRTVSAWRSRKSVPERFLNLLSGKGEATEMSPLAKLSPLDQQAFSLALFRYTRIMADVAQTGEYRQVWDEFRSSGPFWMLMVRARKDISEAMRERADHPATALALLLHDDIEDPERTMERDRSSLAQLSGLRTVDEIK